MADSAKSARKWRGILRFCSGKEAREYTDVANDIKAKIFRFSPAVFSAAALYVIALGMARSEKAATFAL